MSIDRRGPAVQSYRANYAGAQTDAAFLTVATGQKAIVTQAQIVASNANTASPACRVGFGMSTCPANAGVIVSHPGVPARAGVSRGGMAKGSSRKARMGKIFGSRAASRRAGASTWWLPILRRRSKP